MTELRTASKKQKPTRKRTKAPEAPSPSGGLSKSERVMMAKARQACGPFAGSNPFKAAV